jgi:hypothetical protein
LPTPSRKIAAPRSAVAAGRVAGRHGNWFSVLFARGVMTSSALRYDGGRENVI